MYSVFKKRISIKLSKCIEVNKAEYTHIQVIPSKSCKNTNTDKILVLANTMYKKLDKLIRIENKKLIIESKLKLSYYIHISKQSTEFYFIVPSCFYSQVKTKLSETWKNVEINKVDSLPININECTKYQLQYKLNDVLSLNVDKRNNSLLNANMSILEILQTDEAVGIFYNFIPMSQKEQNYFKISSREALCNFKKGINLKKSKNIIDLGVITLKFLVDFINGLLNAFLNTSSNNVNMIVPFDKQTSTSTTRKTKSDIIKTQAIIIAKSDNKDRENQLCTTLYNTFSSVNGDNELEMQEVKKDLDFYKDDIKVKSNYTSVLEAGKFINVAGKDIIEQHKNIKHNKILELRAPRCLENGDVRIGDVKVKDNKQMTYYSTDEQMKRMGRVLLGPMGAGKDYYMTNLAKDIIKAGRGLIVEDYIDKCQLADSIKAITPPDRLIEIDCTNPKTLQTFSYDEYSYNDSMTEYEKVDVCMQKAQQYNMLLDTINDVNSTLTPRMLRYLNAAATIVFRVNQYSSLKDIIDILKNPKKRDETISRLPKTATDLLKDEIDDLEELSKRKNGTIENADTKIDGILDRISKLKSSSIFTKLAYVNESSNNIDFIKAINEGKVILIKIPAKKFSKTMRSLLATFFLQKIWIAKEQGATQTQTELFINEIHQSYHCQLLMEDILVECRKFNLTPTLSLHYLDQCTKNLQKSILASGASFLLIQGTDIKVYNELKRYFEKDGYTETDLAELERYHALCLIKNEDTGYSSFVCKLPA
ncbi:P-loop containing nucleoside triphosphate hydrolase [Romboutsia lituseburensis]|uniref:AAA-like domain-containing protein n=1 Tax=Romboutsia lituseburensis DSM 797 TaxID=1121325 RepID=A0A1G9TWR8_9FIRM|nr:P-loop containing nucleoside triphosphate hydrolase [Romboutsia lituseburensis]SDM52210.1 hypothetical protein SAMN04515677_1141 [Romboutsia lituseburensis DSM 797]